MGQVRCDRLGLRIPLCDEHVELIRIRFGHRFDHSYNAIGEFGDQIRTIREIELHSDRC